MSDAPDATVATLVIEEIAPGSGPAARRGDDVLVHYVGRLTDGRQFDSSRARRDPLDFSLGAGDLIRGFDEGVSGMRVGGRRRLAIPPHLGYGEKGCGGVIPPGATLYFDIELLEIA